MKKITKAMIFAAGFGKRLVPMTDKTPKPLLQLNGKTLLEKKVEFSPMDIPLSFESIIVENSTSAVLSIKSIASLLGAINCEFLIIILLEMSISIASFRA